MDEISYSPEFKKISSEMEDALFEVQKEYAYKFLEYYRGLLKPYNLKRHKLTLLCAMGSSCVLINGKLLQDANWSRSFPLTDLILDIEESMDWDWSHVLDGQSLN